MDDLLASGAHHDGARPCALLEVPCRRRGARRGRRHPWRLQCRERRLSAGTLRRGRGDRRAWSPTASGASLECAGDRARAGGDHAVRRLPPEAARVRRRRPADPSLRPRRAAPHRDPGRAAADVLRPAALRHDRDRRHRVRGARLQAARSPWCWAPASAASPRRSRPSRRIPYGELPGFPPTGGRQPCRQAGARPCRRRRRSPCCRAARTTTSTAAPTR